MLRINLWGCFIKPLRKIDTFILIYLRSDTYVIEVYISTILLSMLYSILLFIIQYYVYSINLLHDVELILKKKNIYHLGNYACPYIYSFAGEYPHFPLPHPGPPLLCYVIYSSSLSFFKNETAFKFIQYFITHKEKYFL